MSRSRSRWLDSLRNRSLSQAPRRRAASKTSRRNVAAIEALEHRIVLSASPISNETIANAATGGTQRFENTGGQAIGVAADGSYVVTWESSAGDGSTWGVYARRFDAAGAPLGGQFLVNSTTANSQEFPSIDVAADGSFVVVWQSLAQDGDNWGVYARAFSAAGAPTTGEIQVAQTTAAAQRSADVALIGGGNFAVTWDGNGVGDSVGVFARVFDSSGAALTNEFRVNSTTANSQSTGSIVSDGSGNFAVVWAGRGPGDASGITFRKFNSAGTPLTGEVLVNQTTAGNQTLPTITLLGGGNFAVAWTSNAAGTADVSARVLDTNGAPLGDEFTVNQTVAGVQQRPTISKTQQGFSVAWEGEVSGDVNGIAVRQFDALGNAISNETVVNQTLTDSQQNPSIAGAGSGFIVGWNGRGPGDTTGIFTRRYAVSYDFTVNTLADTVDANPGDGLALDASGFTSLRAAIMEANALAGAQTIFAPAGTYTLTLAGAGEDGGATGDLDVTGELAIYGATNTIVDAAGLDRVFHVLAGADVEFFGLTVQGGAAANGGGIANYGDLAVHNSVIRNNAATLGAGISNQDHDTPGDAHLRIIGSSIHDNAATSYAGGVYNFDGTTDITNSDIYDNSAPHGGGVANHDGGDMTIIGSSITNNSATTEGGGLSNENSELTVLNSTFSGNTSDRDGGGIFNFAGEIHVTGSTFDNNTASRSGGGIENTGNAAYGPGFAFVDDSFFTANSADAGGAINNKRNSQLEVTDSEFTSNTADFGGAIANADTEGIGPGHASIAGSTFTGNISNEYAGAFFNLFNTAEIQGSTFSGNVAREGGAIANLDDGVLTITGSRVEDNFADHEGGGLTNELATLYIVDTDVVANSTLDDGGGLFNFAGEVHVSDSRFTDNSSGDSAGDTGGGIENTGSATYGIGVLEVTGSTFTGNFSYEGGGINNRRASSTTITFSDFIDNTAIYGGGGVATQENGTLTIEDSNFDGNQAIGGVGLDFGGGGVAASGGTTNIRRTIFTGNTAVGSPEDAPLDAFGFGGGIVAIEAALVNVEDSEFYFNSADEGGGIYNGKGDLAETEAPSTLNVYSSTFEDNTAYQGGAIDTELSWLNVYDSTFDGNSSTDDGGAINNFGSDVYIEASHFLYNTAAASGGAIYNSGRVTALIGHIEIIDSTIERNTAAQYGGGIHNYRDSVLDVSRSTLSNNRAANGAGVANQGAADFYGGIVNIENSTLFKNVASASGGGIYNYRNVVNLENVTIAYNKGVNRAGGIHNDEDPTPVSSIVNLQNTLITANAATPTRDVDGVFNSLGNNLIGAQSTATGFIASDLVNVGSTGIIASTLANNGGPTQTLALLSGSIAIDAGANAGVGSPVDQRGFTRIVDGDGNSSSIVDIGAYEFGSSVAALFADSSALETVLDG